MLWSRVRRRCHACWGYLVPCPSGQGDIFSMVRLRPQQCAATTDGFVVASGPVSSRLRKVVTSAPIACRERHRERRSRGRNVGPEACVQLGVEGSSSPM